MDKNKSNTGKSRTDHKDTGADDTNKNISPNARKTPSSEYLRRHNQALKVFYITLAKKIGLINPKIAWFNAHIAQVTENEEASIHWNIKMTTHTTVEHRWPDLRVE